MTILCRPAEEGDLDVIDRLVTPVTLATRQVLEPALEKGEFLVAIDSSVGVVGVLWVKGHTIRVISVDRRHRKRGIGRFLIGFCEEPIYLKCPSDLPANEFYKHLGFREESCSLTQRGRLLIHYVRP